MKLHFQTFYLQKEVLSKPIAQHNSSFFYTNDTSPSLLPGKIQKNQFEHQIGQSSILNLKITYGEGGQQVFFKNGAPQHVKMDITFKENFAMSRNIAQKLEG